MSLMRLEAAVRSIDEVVSLLEPSALSCGDAGRLLEVFIKGERLCHVGRTIAAGRAAEGRAHVDAGYKDPSSWLADKAGEPVGKARSELETTARLSRLEKTERAFRAGELSGPQAESIAEAASSDPGSEKDLLDRARSSSLKELRDECERVKEAARSAKESEARYEAIRRGRYLRVWHGKDGATKGQFSLTPDAGARLIASLQPLADRFFEDARRLAVREPSEAYMADALVASLTGTAGPPVPGQTKNGTSPAGASDKDGPAEKGAPEALAKPDTRRAPPPSTVICRVDLSALQRGETHPGEICEIPGVGPVPVSVARELLTDCFLKLVITEAIDVRSVVHYGRTLTAHQRTALQYRDPYCVVPGCGRSFGLENDHIADFSLGGPTCLDNLCRLCAHHHGLKTHHGYKIRGRPGAWEWVAPAKSEDQDRPEHPGTAGKRGRPEHPGTAGERGRPEDEERRAADPGAAPEDEPAHRPHSRPAAAGPLFPRTGEAAAPALFAVPASR